jgi:hypothetical protein
MAERPKETYPQTEDSTKITDGKASTRFGEAVARDIAPPPGTQPKRGKKD